MLAPTKCFVGFQPDSPSGTSVQISGFHDKVAIHDRAEDTDIIWSHGQSNLESHGCGDISMYNNSIRISLDKDQAPHGTYYWVAW